MINNEERHSPSLYYLFGILFLLLLIIQRMQWFSLKIGNAYPMLILPAVLIISGFLGEWIGFWYAFGSGVVLDTLAGRSSVFNTLAFAIIAVTAGLLFHYLLNKNLKSFLVGGFAFSFIYFLAKWLFLYLFQGDISANRMLLSYYLPSALYTALLIVPMYFLLKFIIKRNVIVK